MHRVIRSPQVGKYFAVGCAFVFVAKFAVIDESRRNFGRLERCEQFADAQGGIAPVKFQPTEVGQFDLVASLNSGAVALARINVVARPSVILRSIYAVPLIGQMGKPVTIAVQVVKNLAEPVVDMSVLWTVDDVPLRGTVSDDKGWSKVVFAPVETGSVIVRASVNNPVGTAESSLTLVVV